MIYLSSSDFILTFCETENCIVNAALAKALVRLYSHIWSSHEVIYY